MTLRDRAVFIGGVGVVVCLGLLTAACSSSAKPRASSSTTAATASTTPPSTLPPKELAAALKSFFASKPGRDLLTFEKLTRRLVETPTLTHAQCQPLLKELAKMGPPDYFLGATTHIPDPELSRTFQRDVSAKRLYLAACDTSTPLPADAGAQIAPYLDQLRTVMAKHGYTI
jgi:hypothetical protein